MRPLLLVLDVDGVTRRGITDAADPDVLDAVRGLIEAGECSRRSVHVAFVSGTPSAVPSADLPEWCGCNAPLSHVFGDVINDLVASGRVSIHGQLGGDALVFDEASKKLVCRPVMSFTRAEQLQCLESLLEVYHQDVALVDSAVAARLKTVASACLERARVAAEGHLDDLSTTTPIEFAEYALLVREVFDPDFRLVSNGATIEYHDFKTSWKAADGQLRGPPASSHSSGIAHRDHVEFRFVIITSTNKGSTVARLKESQKAAWCGVSPLLVTVGDTAIDYPMHAVADAGFHVGAPSVWESRRADFGHVTLVRPMGVESTAHVVRRIASVLGADEMTPDTLRGLLST